MPRLVLAPKIATAVFLTLAIPSLTATPSARAAKPNFSGDWFVRWCDKNAPQADCGGFSITLVQNGDRICGSYDGARVRLLQIDEGNGRSILGAVVGRVAILTIESARSGDIYLIRATVNGDSLRWRMLDTVKDVDGDIDIIAFDETLARRKQNERSERSFDIVSGCTAPTSEPAK